MIGSNKFPLVMETDAEMEVKGRSGEGKASGKIRRGEEGDGRSGEGKASGKSRRIDDKAGKSAKEEEKMSKMEDDERMSKMEEEEERTVCKMEDEERMSKMEEDEDEEEPKMEEVEMLYFRYLEREEDEARMLDYRIFWEVCWGGRYGSFEDIRVTQVALQCHSTQRKARLERYNAQGSHEEIMAGLLPPVFMGFITGWKPFAEANNLQIGDRCELLKELDEEAGTSVRYSDHKKNEESGWVRHLR